ncbi:ABC transporter ATP-binding protein [Flavihumibacter cheonanensis]|jgi:ABC-2 type transport system ATP-binding protein|uniref:ABC transporter ATP-binding protein n=1 Tax=Flavihumibacter cheonanensis TaxID=1442385 RepID=UPI001EF7A759|nr:ATP-binding cassette domain-containing protein [Flavihumibacter cheonanensis]MCG7754597.1 ATP-binding cassette domain-containing protein [Flavihumibacter cheonanensis]
MISIQNIHFRYKNKPVFSGLSLDLQPGHIYGLLGKNGTGKSTLLRLINGLLFPKEGKLNVLGYTPAKRQPAFLKQVFLVPEEFYLPNISINEFLTANTGFYPQFSAEQFTNYLGEFAIPRDQHLQEMSYGQKKKLLISFGLACNTPILLMDEPTNGLDIVSKSQFRKVMAGAVSEEKCILISTHQVKDLENLIDRITIIDEGGILFDQTIGSITNRLHFKISFDSEEVRSALYKETSLKGNAIILLNDEGEEGRLDLEMLYKAIISNKEAVQKAFK